MRTMHAFWLPSGLAGCDLQGRPERPLIRGQIIYVSFTSAIVDSNLQSYVPNHTIQACTAGLIVDPIVIRVSKMCAIL